MIESNIDSQIATHYAPQVLDPIKYGESGVLFWFPGCGMTSIQQDIFNNKSILKTNLQGLVSRLRIWQLWGHLASEKTAVALINSRFETEKSLFQICQQTLDNGDEVVLVVGKIDDFPESEKIFVLKTLLKTLEINKRRIHIILNLIDKPWWDKLLITHPEFIALANRSSIISGLPDELLTTYITHTSSKFNNKITSEKVIDIKNNYGSILKLVKESLRSSSSDSSLEAKLGVIWRSLPTDYQQAIKNNIISRKKTPKTGVERELASFGVWNLTGFKKNYAVLMSDPESILMTTLTSEEQKLWLNLKKSNGVMITKDEVISILRPSQGEDLSLWAFDQAISRFRKKLKYAGMDSDQLVTKKGRGYIWSA